MSAVVIDTNVLLVADGLGSQMSEACGVECRARLEAVQAQNQTVLDDGWLILGEYQNKLKLNRPTAGNGFLKWLLQNPQHVSWVTIQPTNAEKTSFVEFPEDKELDSVFDPADRKFVAAANAHPEKPPILQSADSKWLGWEANLKRNGIKLEILCRCELQEIKKRKAK